MVGSSYARTSCMMVARMETAPIATNTNDQTCTCSSMQFLQQRQQCGRCTLSNVTTPSQHAMAITKGFPYETGVMAVRLATLKPSTALCTVIVAPRGECARGRCCRTR